MKLLILLLFLTGCSNSCPLGDRCVYTSTDNLVEIVNIAIKTCNARKNDPVMVEIGWWSGLTEIGCLKTGYRHTKTKTGWVKYCDDNKCLEKALK